MSRPIAMAIAAAIASVCSLASSPTRASEMIIGFGPGGGYDLWARTVASHLGRHLPGKPGLVPKNVPGAGSLTATNQIYSVAPKDGTVIGAVARDVAIIPISQPERAKFDARKLTWIGSPTKETNICIAHKSSGIRTFGDLLKKSLVLGDTGVGTGSYIYPTVLNATLNTKFKIISGYRGSVEVFLAIERGEVQGICESYTSVIQKRPTWIKDGVVNVIFQAGAEKEAEIDAPYIMDMPMTDEQKLTLRFVYAGQEIGRPFIAPPGLAEKTVRELRVAFSTTMKDPAFLAEAKQKQLDIKPVSGERIERLVAELYDTPRSVVENVSRILAKK